MKCETCQLELEDLIYGELSSRRAQEVRAHLADCSACRQYRLELEREQAVFGDYHQQVSREPGTELWASIRERIREEANTSASSVELTSNNETRTGLFAWLLGPMVVRQLAGAFALVVLTVLATVYFISRQQQGPQEIAVNVNASPSPSLPPVSATPTPLESVARETTVSDSMSKPAQAPAGGRKTIAAAGTARRLSDQELIQRQLQRTEREYVAAIRMLDQAIVKRKGSIDGDVYKQYEASLALIDDSIDKSRAALRGRAGDPVAGQFLLAAYARKVELMQEIALR